MIKILSASQTRAADEYTIKTEPIESIDLMERAANCFVQKFLELFAEPVPVAILVGPGNNGGDGLAVGRLLLEEGFIVRYILKEGVRFSADAQVNFDRITAPVEYLSEETSFHDGEVIIDALFGTGLTRAVQGDYALLVRKVNASGCVVVAIDIPSGMLADDVAESDVIINADHTITFERPKLSFLFPESGQYCGVIHVVYIGLDEEFINAQESNYFLLENDDVQFQSRPKFAYKGVFGHVQVFAGSKGKMGAAVLCAKAALMSGTGLVTAHVPSRGELVLQTSVPEVMLTIDEDQDHISTGELLPGVNAICIGPGVGQFPDTIKWFSTIIQETNIPLILDADAINMLSSNQHLLGFVSKRAILTPHLGELARLTGKTSNGKERLDKVIEFAHQHQVVVLIKGAYSAIVNTERQVFFNSTGNPGMAKAGSGDVLAGLITGFVGQGLPLERAAYYGAYYHGLAGDLAVKERGEQGIMASDLLNYLAKAYANV